MPNVIDRKQAAEMLNVSIRTIDRYIQKGTLQKEEINGRIFLRTRDLKPLLDQKKLQNKYLSELAEHEPASPSPAPEERVSQSLEASYTDSEYQTTDEGGEDIYKKLYEEVQEELKAKQERLEGANYRVGQLEGLLKESVPLLEYRKVLAIEEEKRNELEDLLRTFEQDNEVLSQTVESKITEIKQVSNKLEVERFNKKVFVIILVILFLLQPLWLIFPIS
jgi:DNA-binding transcriptional MerR regulator